MRSGAELSEERPAAPQPRSGSRPKGSRGGEAPRSWRRWTFVIGALFLGELFALLGSFTTAGLPREAVGWTRWMSRASVVPQVAIAFATAVLLFARREPRAPAASAPRTASPRKIAPLLGAQLASFGVLYWLSWHIFEAHLRGYQNPELWVGLWIASALATAAMSALCCFSAQTLLAATQRHAPFLSAAVFLGLAAWAAGELVAQDLRLALRGPTLYLVGGGLRLVRDDIRVDFEEFVVGAPHFAIRIAPNCAGFEGIGLSIVFVTAYLGVFRRELRFPQALLLPLLAALTAWCANVLRLGSLILLGIAGWPELAVNGFHSIAGTATFCAVALGTVALSRRWRFFSAPRAAPSDEELVLERDATAAYLLPFLLAMAVGMVAGVFGGAPGLWEPMRIAAVGLALLHFRRELAFGPARDLKLAALAALICAAGWLGLAELAAPDGARELEVPAAGAVSFGFLCRLFSYVVIAPLVEELAFRGYLMRRLSHANWSALAPRQASMVAWLLSSLVFGLLHPHWIGAALSGALYGLVYLRSGSLFAAIIAHALTNALLAVYALALATS
ncbi:MAG: exosortase E/protease, VPEID-CTERM system [Planctomycetes bacterium]|nr:exosortase E/protease, VPEID-CTERM system [Planctomycetota bacterium]